ncbi:Hypothetical protein EfmE4452_1413 [Enterococcus faecium E4452]|nr:Hypothetical protein EfmE4452_1413 [Enterococcus faecium E4452]
MTITFTPVIPATTASLPTNSQSVVLTAERQQLGWIPKSKLKITIVFVLKSKLRLKL